jgi:L-ribulokinase
MALVAGIDFGTASVRVSVVDSDRGRLAAGVASYPLERRPDDPDHATQRHEDHLRALERAMAEALAAARVPGTAIEAIAVDTTGSTVVAVDEHLEPLGSYYLWCDHRAWREAAEITARGRAVGLEALDWCGGVYSSEWGFAKVLHWLRHASEERRARFHTAVEHCDLIAATLCGIRDPAQLPRSVCAMGHKWMWNAMLGGLPSEDFLAGVDPLLAGVRDGMSGRYGTSDSLAGELTGEWASRLGLRAGIPIPVGALDAHWDAVGAGCRLGDVVNVIGTSTCIMALSDVPRRVPGVSGVVQGSIHPGRIGIEAGLSATGDLFDAIARRAGTTVPDLAQQLGGYHAGQTGLLRLAWDNGDRSVLVDPRLAGVTIGWRLTHTAADELFAAIEGTALHTRIILDRLQECGVPVDRVINGGGIPQKSEVLNRVYASALGKPILVPATPVTSLGSAIFACLAAGAFPTIEKAQEVLCPAYRVTEPDPADARLYDELYDIFRELYFQLGRSEVAGRLVRLAGR